MLLFFCENFMGLWGRFKQYKHYQQYANSGNREKLLVVSLLIIFWYISKSFLYLTFQIYMDQEKKK